MKKLPENVEAYKKTPVFTHETVPAGLLKTHTTKKGTWGVITIISGELLYVIESEQEESIELSTLLSGVVEPEIPHHVKLKGDVQFFVEFHKENL